MLVAQEDAVATLIQILSEGKSAKFASVTYRAKGTGELARHTLILNFDMQALYRKDVEVLEAVTKDAETIKQFTKTVEQATGEDISPLIASFAVADILKSLNESLTVGIGHNHRYTHSPENADTYVEMIGVNGVKVHKESGECYVMGMTQGKVVLEAGEYKHYNHSLKTLCKMHADKMLRRGKIRQFIIRRVTRAALNGEVLEIEGEN